MLESFDKARKRLIQELSDGGITDKRVLDAMAAVPRESFMAGSFSGDAYANKALPIGEGQTISQPYVVALMTHALDLARDHKVLEIGTGSGYQLAVLCKVVRRAFSIERHVSLARSAEQKLHSLGIFNFATKTGDGTLGWPEQAPFDRIIVTAAAPEVPQALLDQLKPQGILVAPIGPVEGEQKLMRYYRRADGSIGEYYLGQVRFVPLVGKQGITEKVGQEKG